MDLDTNEVKRVYLADYQRMIEGNMRECFTVNLYI